MDRAAHPVRMASLAAAALTAVSSGAVAAGTGATQFRVGVPAGFDALSSEHREVIVLRELQQFTYEEIAETLGIPRGTVESRLSRARAAFRKKFEGEENQQQQGQVRRGGAGGT